MIRTIFALYECTIMKEKLSLEDIRECHGNFPLSIKWEQHLSHGLRRKYPDSRQLVTFCKRVYLVEIIRTESNLRRDSELHGLS